MQEYDKRPSLFLSLALTSPARFPYGHNLVLVLVAGGKLERGVVLGGKLQPHRPNLQPALQLSRGEYHSKSMEDIVLGI